MPSCAAQQRSQCDIHVSAANLITLVAATSRTLRTPDWMLRVHRRERPSAAVVDWLQASLCASAETL